ncbi:sensor histidine kinase [Paenibacillaceae bacterium WGS1546]|uniref:sensor histidine kinase n=1 Tax=Cohnella sp. WGS1546 TaxID=3366810 RepID=UPI00372CF885
MRKSFILSTLAVVILLVILNNVYFYFSVRRTLPVDFSILHFTNSLVTIATIATVIILIHLVLKTRDRHLSAMQMKHMDEIGQLMTSIKGERHDLLKHLNTVHALVMLGQYDELRKYTKELVDDVTITNDLILIGHPSISALMHSKLILAQQSNIPFAYQCENLSRLPSGVRSLDIVRLIGNLLDNAFDAVADSPLDRRHVHLRVGVHDDCLHIVVANSGKLSQDEANAIFKPGYSTKDKHSGLGLPIVKQLVNKYKGTICLDLKEPGIVKFDVQVRLRAVSY